jgi:SAM-dependent methyltransferase
MPVAAATTTAASEPARDSAVATIRKEAAALEPLAKSDLVRRFLKATASLPDITPRRLLRDETKTHYYTPAEAAALPEEQRKALSEVTLDDAYYYNTRYGTPLAYARPLDLLVEAGVTDVAGRKILDFGYGGIGHLRLLASLGADVVGVEVDPLLRALYSEPGDTGEVGASQGHRGTLRLVDGQFPATDEVKRAVGGGYDVIISKNVLKNGYLHPAEPVDPRRLVHLGVDDEAFLKVLNASLNPGGRVLIYNLCPAPAPVGKPYIPWADGHSPFSKSQWEAAGFRVVEFDKDDSAAARKMAHALGWDAGEQSMDLEKDLFATWTLAQKAH